MHVGKMKFGGYIIIVMVHVRRYSVLTLRRFTKNSLLRIFRGSHQPVIKAMGAQFLKKKSKINPSFKHFPVMVNKGVLISLVLLIKQTFVPPF